MSVGVVIVTHYGLGEEFLQALRLIVPTAPQYYAVAVEPTQSVDQLRQAIGSALKAADAGEVVLPQGLVKVMGRAAKSIAQVHEAVDSYPSR